MKLRRRIGRVVWLGLLLALLAGAILWSLTPSGDDVNERVRREAERHNSSVLIAGEVPPLLSDALIATEDERFYQHHGVDVVGVLRALHADLSRHCWCEGGSTITQQLVKRLYLGGSDRGFDKVIDVVITLKIEAKLNKQQILAAYATVAPTGAGRYGMAAAACSYFGRPLSELDVAQYALLAGMPQAPSSYDPLLHPDAARHRRSDVLRAMEAQEFITPEKRVAAEAEPPLNNRPGYAC